MCAAPEEGATKQDLYLSASWRGDKKCRGRGTPCIIYFLQRIGSKQALLQSSTYMHTCPPFATRCYWSCTEKKTPNHFININAKGPGPRKNEACKNVAAFDCTRQNTARLTTTLRSSPLGRANRATVRARHYSTPLLRVFPGLDGKPAKVRKYGKTRRATKHRDEDVMRPILAASPCNATLFLFPTVSNVKPIAKPIHSKGLHSI